MDDYYDYNDTEYYQQNEYEYRDYDNDRDEFDYDEDQDVDFDDRDDIGGIGEGDGEGEYDYRDDFDTDKDDTNYVTSIKAFERLNYQKSVLEQLLISETFESDINKILKNIGKYKISAIAIAALNLNIVISDINKLEINIKIPDSVKDNMTTALTQIKYGSTKNPLGIVLGYLYKNTKTDFDTLVKISENKSLSEWGMKKPDIVKYIYYFENTFSPVLQKQAL